MFKYPELTRPTSTRLLKLAPKSHNLNGQLQGEILEIDLDNAPKFEAISYVWGKRVDTSRVYCSTKTQSRMPLLLSGNGEDVLRAMQHSLRSRLLWIDAISINQKSLEERNHQVRIMSQIYAKARSVLVWLPSDDEFDGPYNGCKSLRLFLRLCNTEKLAQMQPLSSQLSDRLNQLLIKWFAYHAGYAAKQLCKSPWFTRVWTVLEFAFARRCKIFYSANKAPIDGVSWWKLSEALRSSRWNKLLWFGDHLEEIRFLAKGIIKYSTRDKAWSQYGFDIHWTQLEALELGRMLFLRTRQLHAALPVDKVFAVSSILASHPHLVHYAVTPDYAMPASQLFQKMAKLIIETESKLAILLERPAIEDAEYGCSWAPDLAVLGRRRMRRRFDLPPLKKPMSLSSNFINNILRICGRQVDFVALVGKTFNKDHAQQWHDDEAARSILADWFSCALAAKRTNSYDIERFCRTCSGFSSIIAARLAQAFVLCMADPDCPEWLEWITSLSSRTKEVNNLQRGLSADYSVCLRMTCDHIELLNDDSTSDFTTKLNDVDSNFRGKGKSDSMDSQRAKRAHTMAKSLFTGDIERVWGPESFIFYFSEDCEDRTFFVTSKGYFGVTNGDVEVGDKVVLIPAVAGPAVLRRVPDSDQHRFCGAADISGMMPPHTEDDAGVDWSCWEQELQKNGMQWFDLV